MSPGISPLKTLLKCSENLYYTVTYLLCNRVISSEKTVRDRSCQNSLRKAVQGNQPRSYLVYRYNITFKGARGGGGIIYGKFCNIVFQRLPLTLLAAAPPPQVCPPPPPPLCKISAYSPGLLRNITRLAGLDLLTQNCIEW